ncbi:gamma carbonic anhydrase 1, mitochondrial, partial [Tanacetum coccineum]
EAFVGMKATLLDGVVVEKHAMVAAGALVRQDTRIPSGEIWKRSPMDKMIKRGGDGEWRLLEVVVFVESVLGY